MKKNKNVHIGKCTTDLAMAVSAEKNNSVLDCFTDQQMTT
jgi:hypothetical protein